MNWINRLAPIYSIILAVGQNEMPGLLARAAFASVARLAVVPLQDVLALGGEHRMNQPGVADGCWRWRFEWNQVKPEITGCYQHWLNLYGRI